MSKVERQLTVAEKESAVWEAGLDAFLRYRDGEVEGDEVMNFSKGMNLIVKKAGVEAHREGNAIAILQMVHANPEARSKAAAALRPDIKSLGGS